ncbi:hypothetical protein GQ44DRAFT_733515 [Phaeosphaeriaceae sp. PMI808]|nr:hypothetical protein GQ44DRAFT_733515 [Phaeosphaeriaceae sp. PMI808]
MATNTCKRDTVFPGGTPSLNVELSPSRHRGSGGQTLPQADYCEFMVLNQAGLVNITCDTNGKRNLVTVKMLAVTDRPFTCGNVVNVIDSYFKDRSLVVLWSQGSHYVLGWCVQASLIDKDTLSTLSSSQFGNLSFTERDPLDVEFEELDQTTASSRKRTRQKEATELWSYSREPKGAENVKDKFGHKIWYCGETHRGNRPYSYFTTTLRHARKHLTKDHLITTSDESQPSAKPQPLVAREDRF